MEKNSKEDKLRIKLKNEIQQLHLISLDFRISTFTDFNENHRFNLFRWNKEKNKIPDMK
jgi:hypothetical protein